MVTNYVAWIPNGRLWRRERTTGCRRERGFQKRGLHEAAPPPANAIDRPPQLYGAQVCSGLN